MIKKYPSLNGLRAISIILVICHHLAGAYHHIFSGIPKESILTPFINVLEDGHMGVNVFFVISGFLITSLLIQEEIQTKTISLKNFFIRRTLRIFPAYYFLLLVYFILQCFHYIDISKEAWLTALTYTKYFNWIKDWFTSHAWSLSIEENFYIIWPFIFIAGVRFRKIMAISLIIIVPFFRIYFSTKTDPWLYDLTIFTRIDAIATGCLFALYKDNILQKIKPYMTFIFYFSIGLLLLLPYTLRIPYNPNLSMAITALGLTHGTVANFLIAFIMMYSVFGPQKIWFKLLNTKLFNYIGLLSYSLYLWQQFFISWLFIFPNNVFYIIGAALFSYYVIEKPFLKLKSKFSKVKNDYFIAVSLF